MKANQIRGEISISLDGSEFVLRPTFEASLAIENQTGKSLFAMAYEADEGRLSLAEMGVVVAEYIKAWGRETEVSSTANVNTQRITELIFQEGVAKAMPRVALVLAEAITGGVKPGEMTATGTMTKTATPVAD